MNKSIKRIFTVIIAIGLFMACDPMADVYDELDKNPSAISSDLNFTLEEDDYELSGDENAAKYKSFSSIDDAKEGIPNILTEKYPQLGAPSSAIVQYDLYQGSVKYSYDDYENDYVGGVVTNPIPVYEVTQDDYDAVLGEGNYGNFGNIDEIRDFLDYKYPDAWDNNGVLLTYKYYSGTTEIVTNTFSKHYDEWYMQRVLSKDAGDYAYMGRTGDYFSSQDEAEEKIPVWLNPQFPFAKAGDRYLVQYLWRNYDNEDDEGTPKEKPELVLSEYNGSAWMMVGSIVEAQLQLGHDGTNWVPDNTIKYEMTSADYTAVSEAYASINPDGSASMASYGNYDITLWSDDEITESIGMILLDVFPGSEQGQKYLVFYSVWTGSSGETRTEHLILSGDKYVPVGSE